MAKQLLRPAVVLLLGSLAAGLPACTPNPHHDTPFLRLSADDPKQMSKATEDGTYILFLVGDPTPKLTVKLKAGDPRGFGAAKKSKVIAIGGDQEMSFPTESTFGSETSSSCINRLSFPFKAQVAYSLRFCPLSQSLQRICPIQSPKPAIARRERANRLMQFFNREIRPKHLAHI